MSSQEVADLYGVEVITVHRWAKAGLFDVPPERLPGGARRLGAYVFDREAVEAQHQREQEDGVI
jgi:predicted site-specific integrase-resolvase